MKNIMIGLFLTAILVLAVSDMGLLMRLIWDMLGPVVSCQVFIFIIVWVLISIAVRSVRNDKKKNQKTETK